MKIHSVKRNIMNKQQYIHGGINVIGEKFLAGIVFRLVNIKERYDMKDDTMVVSDMPHHNEIIHGVMGLNLAMFRQALSKVYHKVMFWCIIISM